VVGIRRQTFFKAFKSASDTRLRFDRLTVPSLSRETDKGIGLSAIVGRRALAKAEGVYGTYVGKRTGRQVAIGFQECVKYEARPKN